MVETPSSRPADDPPSRSAGGQTIVFLCLVFFLFVVVLSLKKKLWIELLQKPLETNQEQSHRVITIKPANKSTKKKERK